MADAPVPFTSTPLGRGLKNFGAYIVGILATALGTALLANAPDLTTQATNLILLLPAGKAIVWILPYICTGGLVGAIGFLGRWLKSKGIDAKAI